jgi:hypothetical protein
MGVIPPGLSGLFMMGEGAKPGNRNALRGGELGLRTLLEEGHDPFDLLMGGLASALVFLAWHLTYRRSPALEMS